MKVIGRVGIVVTKAIVKTQQVINDLMLKNVIVDVVIVRIVVVMKNFIVIVELVAKIVVVVIFILLVKIIEVMYDKVITIIDSIKVSFLFVFVLCNSAIIIYFLD